MSQYDPYIESGLTRGHVAGTCSGNKLLFYVRTGRIGRSAPRKFKKNTNRSQGSVLWAWLEFFHP